VYEHFFMKVDACTLTLPDQEATLMSGGKAATPSLQALLDAFNAHDLDGIPDIVYGQDRRWTSGDRGVSEWTIRGTRSTGEPIEVRGCDLFEFSDGKISRKDSFWKIVD
jgi:hypothetical protein